MAFNLLGSSASTTNKQLTSTTNQNVQDSAGAVTTSFSAGKGARVSVTDGGAVKAMQDVSNSALALGGRAIDSGQAVSIAGLDYAQAAYSSSLDLVGRTLDKALAQSSAVAANATTPDSARMANVVMLAIGALALVFVLPRMRGAA